MNLQENILRIKEVMGLLSEGKSDKQFSGKNRIIIIGPPTVGKSTVAEELSKQLGIEYVKLDKLQEKLGHGDGKELELVKEVLSNKFEKYNTPSILDFGGGHVYNKGVKGLLKDYPNVILLMPSKNQSKSEELLMKGNTERWTGFIDQIIKGLKSGKHNHTKEKESELIDKLKKMKKGEGGKFHKKDLPNIPEMKGWGGLNLDKDWNKHVPLTKEEDSINKEIAKHTVIVYNKNGDRKTPSEIVKDIKKLLK